MEPDTIYSNSKAIGLALLRKKKWIKAGKTKVPILKPLDWRCYIDRDAWIVIVDIVPILKPLDWRCYLYKAIGNLSEGDVPILKPLDWHSYSS